MGIIFTVQLSQRGIGVAVAEEHRPLPGWSPPHDRVSRARDHSFRQDLNGCRSAEAGHQVSEHLRGDELPLVQSRFLVLVSDFMQRNKRMSIRKAVVTTGPVHQQDTAQPEVLTGADVDGGVHRKAP